MNDLLDDVETAARLLRESGDPAGERIADGLEAWRASRTVSFETRSATPTGYGARCA